MKAVDKTAGGSAGRSDAPADAARDGRPDACRDILQHIAAYLDGELDATECLRIEAHSQQCPDCMTVISGLRDTIGLCRQVGSVPLPEPVRARALASVRRLLASRTG